MGVGADLVLGQYHQHSAEVLDLDASPLVFMRRTFPPPQYKRSEEVWRSYLAQFGFSTKQQTSPIGLLSDGQRSLPEAVAEGARRGGDSGPHHSGVPSMSGSSLSEVE